MNRSNNIGNLIRAHRGLNLVTQQQLNNVLFPKTRNPQFISNVERGRCGLPVKHAMAVSVKLRVPLEIIKEALIEDYKQNLNLTLQKQLEVM